MTYTIKLRRGTSTDWASVNPVLAEGEEGFETDTRKSKHGDGTSAWNDLEYDAAGDPDAMISDPGARKYTYSVSEPGVADDGDLWYDPDDDTDGEGSSVDLTAYATKVYVDDAVAGGVPLDSPAFTGNPTAPTPTPGDDDSSIATTGFVTAALETLTAQVALNPAARSVDGTVAHNNFLLVNATGGMRTQTLPATPADGFHCWVKKVDNSVNQVQVVAPAGTILEGIDGGCVYMSGLNSVCELIAKGGVYYVVDVYGNAAVGAGGLPGGYAWPGWYRADDVASVGSGGSVATWPNRGVGSLSAAVLQGAAPTYVPAGIGGKPSLDFSGSQALKITNLSSHTRPFTAIFVLKVDSYSGHDNTILGANVNANRNWRFNTSSGVQELDRKGTDMWITASGSIAAGTPAIVSQRDDGTLIRLYRNSTIDGTRNNASGYSDPAGWQYIGTTGSADFFDGQIAEMMFTYAEITDAQFTAALASLGTRYGITV